MQILWDPRTWTNHQTRIRRKECPAFGTKCNYCNKDHHFKKMCQNKQSAASAKHEDVLTNVLCDVPSTDSTKHISLTHHVFDKFRKKWRSKS